MKKLLSILAMIFLITSCGEDSSGPSSTSDKTMWVFENSHNSEKSILARINVNTGEVELAIDSRIYHYSQPVNGKFAYSRDTLLKRFLCLSDIYLKNEVVLDSASDLDTFYNQEVSPKGDKVAYVYREDNSKEEYFYIINSDGSGKKIINDFPIDKFMFSPDGSKLAYVTNGWSTIVGIVYDVNTGESRTVFSINEERYIYSQSVDWSPSGDELLISYVAEDEEYNYNAYVYKTRSDGSGVPETIFQSEKYFAIEGHVSRFFNNGSDIFTALIVNDMESILYKSDSNGNMTETEVNHERWYIPDYYPSYSQNEVLMGIVNEVQADLYVYNVKTGDSQLKVSKLNQKLESLLK